ncbi:MAG: cohesin domain-containing protein [Candidatus Aminicenantes bacterium]|nr:cohesin domain-containing protein [Candidatus Aminicenantes bacterium]
MKKATAFAIVLLLTAAACATLSPLYHQGVRAELDKKWDEAIASYEKAALLNPKEAVYRLALAQVKVKASMFYVEEARRLITAGDKNGASAAYAKAVALNPRDFGLAFEAKQALSPEVKKEKPISTKIEFPIKLKVREGTLDLRLSSETSLRAIFQSLGRAGGINIVFDETFRDVPFQTDFTNVTFEQALGTICQATKNFFRIIDERTVLIIPDQPAKRLQYEVNCIRTFYLSNANAQEMTASLTNMLRGAAKIPLIFFDKDLNSITVRDTPQVVELAEKLIRIWDKPKGEVVIDMELMEVSRTRLRQLGISLPFGSEDHNAIGLRYGAPATTTTTTTTTTETWQNLPSLDFSKSGNYYALLPMATLQFLETDSDTKIVAQPRLRGVADEELHQLVGEKIPVPKTTWNPIAAGGYSQQPVTSYDYQDVGIDVKFTPRVHLEKEVTLAMELKVTSLGGKGYADLPIINTRELKGVLRLRDGETTMLAGLLRDSERKSLSGIPFLKNLPGIGRLFGAEDTTIEQTDIIMTITPHIIRTIPINPEDEKVLWVDVNSSGSDSGDNAEFDPDFTNPDMEAEGISRPSPRRRPGAEDRNSILLGPANLEIPAGREFRITAGVQTDGEIGMISLTLNFNPQLLALKNVVDGGLGRSLGGNAPFLQSFDNSAGTCTIGFNSPTAGKGVRTGGTLAALVFEAKAAGEAVVAVTQCLVMDPDGQSLNFRTGQARIRIR